jgi:hypothetical protein
MFTVTEEQTVVIRTVFEQRGEFSAAVELRWMFPGIRDTAQARECVRITVVTGAATPASPDEARRLSWLRDQPVDATAGCRVRPAL